MLKKVTILSTLVLLSALVIVSARIELNSSQNNYYIITGSGAAIKDYTAAVMIKNNILDTHRSEKPQVHIMSDSEFIKNKVSLDNNIISLGGNCVNKVTSLLLNQNYPLCGKDFTNKTGVGPSQFMIKRTSSNHIIVAGYDLESTLRGARYLIASPITFQDGETYYSS